MGMLFLPDADEALPGRDTKMQVSAKHIVLGRSLSLPLDVTDDVDVEVAMFGMGCFWGAERKFWQAKGVLTTAVGYAGGYTPNPLYREVCGGMTGHNEVVWVAYDANEISYQAVLALFWVSHDPTQGMRQGHDQGTQYRSAIYTYNEEQEALAKKSQIRYTKSLVGEHDAVITTEILAAPTFYYAEDSHQQYLAKNPNGYCGLGGTGVAY